MSGLSIHTGFVIVSLKMVHFTDAYNPEKKKKNMPVGAALDLVRSIWIWLYDLFKAAFIYVDNYFFS